MLGTSRQLGVGPVALVSLLVEVGLKGVLTEEECPLYYAQKNDTSLASEADWQLQSELCPDEYAQLAFLTSFLMGLFQIAAGFLRLGFLVSFLAHPVISGFTSAAAIIIGLSQLQYFMGFKIPKSQYIYEVLIHLFKKIDQTKWQQVPLGLASTHLDSLDSRAHWAEAHMAHRAGRADRADRAEADRAHGARPAVSTAYAAPTGSAHGSWRSGSRGGSCCGPRVS